MTAAVQASTYGYRSSLPGSAGGAFFLRARFVAWLSSGHRTTVAGYEKPAAKWGRHQCDDSAGFVLEAHPNEPERRCDERQQGQQHERGKQEQPGSSETWCGCSVPRPQLRTVSGKRDRRRHRVVLCASEAPPCGRETTRSRLGVTSNFATLFPAQEKPPERTSKAPPARRIAGYSRSCPSLAPSSAAPLAAVSDRSLCSVAPAADTGPRSAGRSPDSAGLAAGTSPRSPAPAADR